MSLLYRGVASLDIKCKQIFFSKHSSTEMTPFATLQYILVICSFCLEISPILNFQVLKILTSLMPT